MNMKNILINNNQLKNLVESVKHILTEADKRNVIINKIGYSKEWADEFHNLSDKYSLWIADSYLKKKMSDNNRTKEEALKKINEKGPDATYTWFNGIQATYQYILDWLKAPRREEIDLQNLTYDDAYLKAREWHESLKTGETKKYEETGEIIIDYRDSRGVGYYWVNRKTKHCSEEQKRMGHCGKTDLGDTLFSLRNVNEFGEGQSFITIAYKNDGTVYDFKASGNQKPSPKYHKYIIDILTQDKYPINNLSSAGHSPETNFKISNLKPEQIEYVYSKNEALKYNINDKSSHPYIVKDILDGKLNLSNYSKSHQIDLIRASNDNPKLMEMFKNELSHFNNLLLDNTNDVKFIVKNFLDVFKDLLIGYINEKNYPQFKQALIVISRLLNNYRINLTEPFCGILGKGFTKFKNKELDIISTGEINRAVLSCAKKYKLIDKYAYISDLNKYNHRIVIPDGKNKTFGVIDEKGNIIIGFNYITLSLNKDGNYIGRTLDHDIEILDKNGNLIRQQ